MDSPPQKKVANVTIFWNVIFPILVIILLLFVLFIVYAMPDWALTCSSGLESMRRLASRTTS